jgi:threonine dehydrogenase-like Zn-dependent dehydrogenase
MKTLILSGKNQITLAERKKPHVQPGEALLKIRYVGFCGSDLNTYLGKNPMVSLPVVPGHEIGAEIVEITPDAPEHLHPGIYCTLNPYTNCGHCSACRNGRPNACRFNQTLGVQRDGAMCEYLAVPWQKLITDPALDAKDFALVEPMSVGFHAAARGQVRASDKVLVIGCGMVGAGAIARSAWLGAEVIAVDTDRQKLQLARRLGARYTLCTLTGDPHQRLAELTEGDGTDGVRTGDLHELLVELTGGDGPSVVIEAVGSPSTYRLAIEEVVFTGRVVYIGYSKAEVSFETRLFVMKELNICGSRNALPDDFRSVIDYFKQHPGITGHFVSDICSPEQAPAALARWAESPGHVFRILVRF